MSELNETAIRLADAAEKLLAEVRRVHADTCRIIDRLDPELATGAATPTWMVPRPMRTLKDALDVIELARREILTCEYHLAAIRGRLDEIASDAPSRAQLRTWLKGETPRG